MKITMAALPQILQKGLSPVYLISGDEPLQLQEAADQIRQAANEAGYTERIRLQPNQHFDWSELQQQAQALSLFSTQSLIELRLTATKLGKAGSQAIATYCKTPPKDKILVIISPKLTQSQQQLAWCKACLKLGVFLPVWPVMLAQLPRWITERLNQAGLSADSLAIQRLAESTEGNLLATAQAVEKLALLYGQQHLTYDDIAAALDDQSHFTLYQLVDACLLGDAPKSLHVLQRLQGEGIATTLLLWALWQETTKLLAIKTAQAKQQPLAQIFKTLRIWDSQKPLINAAIRRHDLASLRACIRQAAAIDRINKGLLQGDAWMALTQLCMTLAMGRTHT